MMLSLTILLLSSSALSQITPTGSDFEGNPVQTAVPFLRLSPEAQAGGMGDAALATTPDANAVFWNSAKLPFTDEDAGIALAYTPWLAGLNVDDIHLINAGGFVKTGDDLGAFNFAVRYFSLGETTFRQSQLDPGVIQNPQEFAIQGGYSRKLSDVAGLGVNLKYINSDLATGQVVNGSTVQEGTAIAGDLHFYFDPLNSGNADWSFAAGISNIGSKISYLENSDEKDFLPTNFGLGTNVALSAGANSTVSFALDANKLLVPTPDGIGDSTFKDEGVINAIFSSWGDAPDGFSEELREFQVSLGGEYNYDEKFFGRAGFFYEDESKGNRQYATLGAGARFQNLGVANFAYLFATNNNNSPLDGTLRFSLEFDINRTNVR